MGCTLLRPERYREMAAEIRSIADDARDRERADDMRKIADDYERMAESAAALELMRVAVDA